MGTVALHHIRLRIIDNMQDSRKTSPQHSALLQSHKPVQKTFQQHFLRHNGSLFPVTYLGDLLLGPAPWIPGRSYQGYQDFTRMRSLPHQQMTQISLMTQPVKMSHPQANAIRCKVFQHRPQDQAIILVHNLTPFHRHHIIKAAPLMHAKCKGAVLYFISEGKFHLISILIGHGASLYSLPVPLF